METSIRAGLSCFYGGEEFPHGISRSSYFNKRESEELIKYGHTFKGLQSGALIPMNEEEAMFVFDLSSEQESSLYPVRLWKKYLNAIEKNKVFHGFSGSSKLMKYGSSNDGNAGFY